MNDAEIDREATIAELLGEASIEEMRRVAEWRAASPENEDAYRRLERLLAATDRLSRPKLDTRPPSSRAIVEVAQNRRRAEVERESEVAYVGSTVEAERAASPRRARPGWVVGSMAASLILGLGLGMWLAGQDAVRPRTPESIVTGPGDVVTVTLDDGSMVRVGPESTFTLASDGEVREVSLIGRAYFAVARDEERPFRVSLPGGSIEVLGTRFDVIGRGEELRVTVVEGEVRMEAGGARLNVRERQVGRLVEGVGSVVDGGEDIFVGLDWLGSTLVFESTSFTSVALEFEQRFGLEVQIRDPALGLRTVTGLFTHESPEQMIAGICRAIDAECTLQDGLVVVDSAS